MPTKSNYAPNSETPNPPKKKWPIDIMALAIMTGHLWAVTFAWHIFDLEHLLDPPLHSESDAWLLALSGMIFLYFMLLGIVAAWSFILWIPTCLLAANLSLRRLEPLHRWFISGAVTASLFIGLNHYGIIQVARPGLDEGASESALPIEPVRSETPEDAAALHARIESMCAAPKSADDKHFCDAQQEMREWASGKDMTP